MKKNVTTESKLALVSIVVPTYNNATFIEQALHSIFSQNYPACELIVVDDGSTDNTQAVLAAYADRLHLVSQPNAGSAAARNTGLAFASGKYVVLLDADDWLLAGKFQQQIAMLEANPALGAIHSGWRLVDENGHTIKDVEPWHDAQKLDLATWLKWKPVKMGAMMFRRDWLEKVGYLDPDLRQSHDVDLMLRLAFAGCEMRWLKQPTLCYRHHQESTIRKGATDQAYYALMALDKFYAQPDLPAPIRQREPNTRYFSTMWVSWHLFRAGFPEEAIPYLVQTRELAPYEVERAVMDWLRHYAKWSTIDGRDLAEIRQMWPYFQQAAGLEPAAWTAVNQRLEWWLDVWWYYLQADFDHASQRLGQHPHFSVADLVAMVQFYLIVTPTTATITAVQRFWQDVSHQWKITAKEQYQVTPLYLTLFGQALLDKRWSTALVAWAKALRYGYRPAAWPAWSRFIHAGLTYFSRQPWQTDKVLVTKPV